MKQDLDDLDDTLKPLFNKFKTEFNQYVKANFITEIKDYKNLPQPEEAINSFYQMIMIAFLTGISDSQYHKEQFKKKKDFADDEQYEFDFTPNEAIEHLLKRTAIKRSDFDLLDRQAKFKSFTAVKLASCQAMDKMKNRLIKNLKEGESLGDFINKTQKETEAIEKIKGLEDPNYLEVVYRNNIGSAYNAGKMENAKNDEDIYALEFVAITDDRTTDVCNKLNGVVKPVNDEFWKEWTPPLHHNCRSTFIERYDFETNKPPITEEIKGLPKKNDFSGNWSDMSKSMKEQADKFGITETLKKAETGILGDDKRLISDEDIEKFNTDLNDQIKLFKESKTYPIFINHFPDFKKIDIIGFNNLKEGTMAEGGRGEIAGKEKRVIHFDAKNAKSIIDTFKKLSDGGLNRTDFLNTNLSAHEYVHTLEKYFKENKEIVESDPFIKYLSESLTEIIAQKKTSNFLNDLYKKLPSLFAEHPTNFEDSIGKSETYKRTVEITRGQLENFDLSKKDKNECYLKIEDMLAKEKHELIEDNLTEVMNKYNKKLSGNLIKTLKEEFSKE